MSKSSNSMSKVPLFAQVTFAGAYGKRLPTYLALLIKAVSYLQIAYIILKTSFPSSGDSRYTIFGFIRTVIGIISSFDTYESMQWGQTVTFMIWLGIWFYLIGYMIFVITIIWECKQRKKISKKASKVFTRLNIIHSKLIFFMVHCFGFQLLEPLRQCSQQEDPAFYCGVVTTILTILMLVVNLGIASFIELAVYQTYRDKNVFAVKNNAHSAIQLAHKAILPPLLTVVSANMTVNSLLNLLFAVANHALIFMRLPYFNRLPLKLAVTFSSAHLTSTVILVFRPAINGSEKVFELLVLLLAVGMIVLKLAILDRIFEEILKLNLSSPYYILHLPILLKEYLLKPSLIRVNCDYNYRTLFTYNLMRSHKWEVDALDDQIKSEDLKVKVNFLAAEELLKCYKRNPTSKELLLFMVQFYIEKIKNVTKAYILIEKLQELPLFAPNVNNIKHITNQLQTIMYNAYTEYDKSLELLSYFKNREVSTILKKNIEAEAQLHAEFWGALLKPDVDIWNALQICKKIDSLAVNTEKNWRKNEEDFLKNFPIPLMIYGIYLNVLRGLPHLGHAIIEKFASGKNSRLLKMIEKWFSQEKAMIIASNQKGSLGKIIDATHSVKNIFKIDKNDLIGRKVNMLMPNMIQARHDMMIERYNNRPEISLNFNRPVYCKTADKQFFVAGLSLRVYPYVNKGPGLIAIITKMEETVPVFFVNASGEVVDCSRDLIENFRIDFLASKGRKLKDLVPGFEDINRSFNKVYSHLVVTGKESAAGNRSSSLVEDMHFDEITSKHVKSANTEAHLMISKVDQDILTSGRGLLNSPRMQSVEDTQGLVPSEKDEESHVDVRNFHSSSEKVASKMMDMSTRLNLIPNNDSDVRRKSKIAEIEHAKEHEESEKKVLSEEDMIELCKKYESGSILMLQSAEKGNNSSVPYSIKIEVFLVEGELFKAVRVQKVEKKNGEKSKDGTSKSTNTANNKISNLELNVVQKKLETSLVKMNSANDKSKESFGSSGDVANQKMSMHVNFAEEGNYHYVERANSRSSTSSKSNSSMDKGLRVEKTFYQAFRKDKTSRLVRGYLFCFYLAIALIIALTLVNYFKTKSSFDEVKFATQIVDIGSERLHNLGYIWGRALYSYCAATIDSPASAAGMLIPSNIVVINTLTAKLMQLLDKVGAEPISQAFFSKTITFQMPYQASIFSTTPFDEITALNLVLQKMEPFTRIINSEFDPMNIDYLFPLNNTVNDLLLSVEDDLSITRQVKQDVYDNNNRVLKALIIIQIIACCIIYFSLIPTFISIISDYKKFFKTLGMVSSKSIIARERDIRMFQHGIRESVESEKLIENMNRMIYRAATMSAAEAHETAKIKLNRNGKLVFKTINRITILLLVLALLLFGVIIGIFSASSSETLGSVADLQIVDQAAIIAQNMVFKTIFMAGASLYYMSFYNQTTMKIRNNDAIVQYNLYLDALKQVNQGLLSAINAKPELYPSNIRTYLSGDMCSYLADYGISSSCESVTKGAKTGLFGLNEFYAETFTRYITAFQQAPTVDNYNILIEDFIVNSSNMIGLLPASYMYLKNDLLDIFLTEIEHQKTTLTTYCIGIILSCLFVGLVLRVITLRFLVELDRLRYKVFRVIPASLSLENKVIFFYFKRTYPKEVSEISSLL